ncbi:MAG: hypothetical protein ACQEWV_02690 [Bacillota bacterium]
MNRRCSLPSIHEWLMTPRQLQTRRPVAETALAHPVLRGSGAGARHEN